ncbi:HAD family hydrolase [Candidatus Nesciobacter abundans]|uniref:phosphoglycolate phosphatase n=1 Tax=Candidatus Nesciobacter abundans TaxID=2601668 RepID=A0A5C0UGQ5_9PROT|nr:HAD-IA family hydrolase [Candidatus Nesciobacter abundans]QEK38887.1 HAD family hydrolase [Candidatus Nesciobacter abundans]
MGSSEILKPKLVCWDWSGTIIKSDNLNYFINNYLFWKNELDVFPFSQKEKMKKAWFSFDKSMKSKIQREYKNVEERVEPCINPYALGLIDFFADHEIKQGVVSLASSKQIKVHLGLLGLMQFDFILGSDSGKSPKPDPSTLIDIAESLKIDPRNIWVIGDSELDMDLAKNSGGFGIRVESGLKPVWDMIDKCF